MCKLLENEQRGSKVLVNHEGNENDGQNRRVILQMTYTLTVFSRFGFQRFVPDRKPQKNTERRFCTFVNLFTRFFCVV